MNPSVSLAAPAPAPASGVRVRAWSPLGFMLLLAVLGALRPLSVPDEGRYAELSLGIAMLEELKMPSRISVAPALAARRACGQP